MSLFSEHRLLSYTQAQLDALYAGTTYTPGTTATGSRVTYTGSTPAPTQYITLHTPGGDIGYDPAQWSPATDANGNPTVVPKTTTPTVVPTNAPAGWTDTKGLSPYSGEGHGGVGETPAQFAQRVAATEQRNASLLQQQQMKQQQAQADATRQAMNSAASGAASAAQNMPHSASINAQGVTTAARQSFIEKKRGEGLTDNQIRQLIKTLPPEQTGAVVHAPTSATPTTDTTPTAETPKPAETPSSPATTTTVKASTTPATTTTASTATPTVQNKSGTNLLRNLAATMTDPLEKAMTLYNADYLDSLGTQQTPISYADYLKGKDAASIAQTYDASAQILNDHNAFIQKSATDRENFLKTSFNTQDATLTLQKENADQQLRFQQDRDVRNLAEANRKNINKMSNALSLQGGFGSAGGNAEILDATLKGEQAITDLNKEYGFKRTDVSLQFTQMHNQAYDAYQSNVLSTMDNLETAVSNVDLQGIANEGAKKTALSSAYHDYKSSMESHNKELAAGIKDATTMVYSVINTERDNQRAQETLGWNVLNDAIGKYGSKVPQSIIDRVSKMLPAGTDLHDIINAPTFAERNSKIIARGGTGSGTSIGGTVSGSIPSDNGSTTKQQVADAIDRVARNFGKSVSERIDYRDQMLRRLNSGESLSSLAQSLSQDYWASADAATVKEHMGKQDILAGIGNINSYAEQYGVTPENDGPLGPISARKNSWEAIIGLSAPSYNDMSSVLSNMRATIVHEKYGSRVTDSELALARTYIPDMKDPGNIFFSKLNNLRNYTNYLDQRAFNEQVGLPLPPSPKPVTASGKSPIGAAKYSAQDLLNALK